MNIPRRQNSRHFVSHKSRCRSIARDYHSKPVLDAEPHSRCQNFSNSLESHVSVNRRPGDRGKLPKSPFSRNTDQVGERHFVRKADYTGQVLEARSSFVLSQARFPMEAFVQHQETTRDI
jgi:hypothetical protein